MKKIFAILALFTFSISIMGQGVVTRQNSKPKTKVSTQNKKKTSVSKQSYIQYKSGDMLVCKLGKVSFDMILVKAGTFTMGATSEQQNPYDDEKPTHQVTLTNDYYIGKTEVTQALWQAVMGSNPSHEEGDNKPIDQVSWNDCQTFISKLNSLTGKNFRLPTEAEWEFAARGGNNSKGYQYSGSNNIDNVAWYINNSNTSTHEVAARQPNELGIFDMSGNVSEWCQDWYGDYNGSTQTNPIGSPYGPYRVRRGGDYIYGARECRSTSRGGNPADKMYYGLGLRLVLSE